VGAAIKEPGQRTVELSEFHHFREICGVNDEQLRALQKEFDVTVVARNGSIFITGGDKAALRLSEMFMQYNELIDSGVTISPAEFKFSSRYFMEHDDASIVEIFSGDVRIKTPRKTIIPRGLTQRAYIYSLMHADLTIATGPAGTGKTYLAMATAVSELLNKKISRIVLTRPAVEAGESLGFLPGDLNEKITPYLRPLYDAMYDMLGPDRLEAMMGHGEVEVAPLAYMRGRTLNDSYIILDEAQNCTSEQMKMFLTRLGTNSRAAVTGDITQIDLSKEKLSGLVEADKILGGIKGIDIIRFSKSDVVRHPLVEKIVSAYELHEAKSGKGGGR
jgi:phosphate starvation-inducible PhoH-like protein